LYGLLLSELMVGSVVGRASTRDSVTEKCAVRFVRVPDVGIRSPHTTCDRRNTGQLLNS
jgi:hypothetical protein